MAKDKSTKSVSTNEVTLEVRDGRLIASFPLIKPSLAPTSKSEKSRIVGGTGGYVKVEGVDGFDGLRINAMLITPNE